MIDWQHITDLTTDGVNGGTSLNTFLTALNGMGRQGSSTTCVDCGMAAAITEINTNDYFTTRANGRVIDISTDGVGNTTAGNCGGVVACAQTQRGLAEASNIIINGLGVGASASTFLTNNVVTPLNGATKAGFVQTASDFDQFETAITNKLIREVGPPGPGPGDSVPGPLPILGAGAAFGFSRKLRRRINTANLHQALLLALQHLQPGFMPGFFMGGPWPSASRSNNLIPSTPEARAAPPVLSLPSP